MSKSNMNKKNVVLDVTPVNVTNDEIVWAAIKNHLWDSWELPVIACILLVLGVLGSLILAALWLKRQEDKREKTQGQWIFHPVVSPPLEQGGLVQPPVTSEPIRIKAKGLLERRGSNASLTIDLNPTLPETTNQGVTPTRECTAEEYLLSAGNRLSRRQLRSCLKDVKALHTEFWEIPSNHPERTEIAGSGTKNRYRTILPNERTRVCLPDKGGDPLTEYINANFIRGYDGEEKAYIATQGPLPHTVDDFWTMVFNERAPVVVMITKLKEKGRVKCEPYIPEHTGVYGDVHVTVKKVMPRNGYTIRELFVQKDKDFHQVLHYWYTAWPDHKTPSSAKSLVAMATEVEAARRDNNGKPKGPVVVHCSAGIGRSGCFIAMSIGMNQLLEENNVDILGIVCALRYDRGGMVQTGEQYEFVHRALSLFERSLPDQAGE